MKGKGGCFDNIRSQTDVFLRCNSDMSNAKYFKSSLFSARVSVAFIITGQRTAAYNCDVKMRRDLANRNRLQTTTTKNTFIMLATRKCKSVFNKRVRVRTLCLSHFLSGYTRRYPLARLSPTGLVNVRSSVEWPRSYTPRIIINCKSLTQFSLT